jgi:hypothetical protein
MAKDIFHDCVKNALIKDGWTITDDPLRLELNDRKLYVDLGAERLLTAEKGTEKIAVEIKSFVGRSEIADLYEALGQYLIYQTLISRNDPDRILFLAIPEEAFMDVFDENNIGSLAVADYKVKLIVYEPDEEVIIRWIP